MRKNNHETLADHLKKMVSMFNQHYIELEKRLDFIQLIFTETQYVQGRPLMTDKALKAMAIVYSLGASLLAPCEEIQTAFRTFNKPLQDLTHFFCTRQPLVLNWDGLLRGKSMLFFQIR